MPRQAMRPVPILSGRGMELFWSRVDRLEPQQCWNWLGACFRSGYGRFTIDCFAYRATRVLYTQLYGPIPPEMLVCHTCDNPKCCNPAHLFVGTQKTNMQDAVAKGRIATGERHGMRLHPERVRRGQTHRQAKLSDTEVLEIRRLYAQGHVTQRELAAQFGIHQVLVSMIVLRKRWKHI